ncbi:glycosyltransferase family 2 protein [bacterium]|nr:glycosyltransferase family 2 protein [bacterium]
MLFSIVLPAYNCEAYLGEAVESVLSQSFNDWELILVDDGSADSTPEICDSFTSDERVRVIHKPNGGASSARNAGMRVACGSYIAFLDADDKFGNGYLERLAASAREHPADFLLGSVRTDFGAETSPLNVTLFDASQANSYDIPRLLRYFFGPADDAPFAAWHNLYSRDFLRRNRLEFDESLIWSEDRDFVLRVLAASPSFWCIAILGYEHRVGVETSVTGDADAEKILLAMACDEKWMRISEADPLFECSKLFFACDYIGLSVRALCLSADISTRVVEHALGSSWCFSNAPLGKIIHGLLGIRAPRSLVEFVSRVSCRIAHIIRKCR